MPKMGHCPFYILTIVRDNTVTSKNEGVLSKRTLSPGEGCCGLFPNEMSDADSFTPFHSFDKYLLSVYCVPRTHLGRSCIWRAR